MKLSELKATLQEIRVSPVRSLGQNFLHDQNIARAIVESADVRSDDFIVEIGPGLGALTTCILDKGATILAIEKDGRLTDYLQTRLGENKRLQVAHMDAMDFDVRTLFVHRSVKLIANLPYYIASQIMLRFLDFPSPISLAVLMLQKEVAQRLAAKATTPQYGALTLRLQHDYRIELLRTVPQSVFVPQPEIDSAVIRLTPRGAGEAMAIDRAEYNRMVRAGFSQRRKQLRKLLEIPEPEWIKIAEEIQINPNARAEELTLSDWVNLTNKQEVPRKTDDSPEPEEMFPVVNENNVVLRVAPRTEVHANNLRHRAVHILLFNAAGELLLQKRSASKDRHPLQWDSSAAGHVDAGEEYDATAARELKEELGVEAQLTEIGQLAASDATGQEFIRIYTGRHNGPFRIATTEIQWAGFFPMDVVKGWVIARSEDFAPGFLECWRVFRAGLN